MAEHENYGCGFQTLFTEPSVKDDVARKSGLEIKAADFEEVPVSDITVGRKKNFGTVNNIGHCRVVR